VHVHVPHIHTIWFLVILSTESSKALFIQVCLNRINTFDYHIDTNVEFLILYQEGIFDVPLDKVFHMVGIPWQVMELLDQCNTVTSSTL